MSVTKRIASGDYNLNTTSANSNVIITTTTLKVYGDFYVQGNSTVINVANINSVDPTIRLNSNAGSIFSGNSGIEINRPGSYVPAIYWNETVAAWQIATNIANYSTYSNIGTSAGTGTVNSGTATQLAYYASSGTAVSTSGAKLTWDTTSNTLTVTGNVTATNLTLNGTYITAGAVGAGGTGLYFSNSTADELASKSAAIKYSIIFG